MAVMTAAVSLGDRSLSRGCARRYRSYAARFSVGREKNVAFTVVVSIFPSSDGCWSVASALAGRPSGVTTALLIVYG